MSAPTYALPSVAAVKATAKEMQALRQGKLDATSVIARREQARYILNAVAKIQKVWRGYYVRKYELQQLRDTYRIRLAYGSSMNQVFDVWLRKANAFEVGKDDAVVQGRKRKQRKLQVHGLMQNAIKSGVWRRIATPSPDMEGAGHIGAIRPSSHASIADIVQQVRLMRRRSSITMKAAALTAIQDSESTGPASPTKSLKKPSKQLSVSRDSISDTESEDITDHADQGTDKSPRGLLQILHAHFRSQTSDGDPPSLTVPSQNMQRERDRALAKELCQSVTNVAQLGVMIAKAQEATGKYDAGSGDRSGVVLGSIYASGADTYLLNDDKGYHFPHALNEGHFSCFLFATGLLNDNVGFSVVHNMFMKHSIVLRQHAHLLHLRRKFDELVDITGRVPLFLIATFTQRCGLSIPRAEVTDYTERCGGPLSWAEIKPWLDERRYQAEGERPYSRDGLHPRDDAEAAVSGLTRAGFCAAITELMLSLCPPSPLCACQACIRNRDPTNAAKAIPWPMALSVASFAALHDAHCVACTLDLCARTIDRCVNSDAWPFTSTVGTLLLSNGLRKVMVDYEKPLTKLFTSFSGDSSADAGTATSRDDIALQLFVKNGIFPNLTKYTSTSDATLEATTAGTRMTFTAFQRMCKDLRVINMFRTEEDLASAGKEAAVSEASIPAQQPGSSAIKSPPLHSEGGAKPLEIMTAYDKARIRTLRSSLHTASCGVTLFDAFASVRLGDRVGRTHTCMFQRVTQPPLCFFNLTSLRNREYLMCIQQSKSTILGMTSPYNTARADGKPKAVETAFEDDLQSFRTLAAVYGSLGLKVDNFVDTPSIESRLRASFRPPVCNLCTYPQFYQHTSRQLWQLAVSFAEWALKSAVAEKEAAKPLHDIPLLPLAALADGDAVFQLVSRDSSGNVGITARILRTDVDRFLAYAGRMADTSSIAFRRMYNSLRTNAEGLVDWKDFISALHVHDRMAHVMTRGSIGRVEFVLALALAAQENVAAAAAKQARTLLATLTGKAPPIQLKEDDVGIPLHFVHASPAPKFSYFMSRMNGPYRRIFGVDMAPVAATKRTKLLEDSDVFHVEQHLDSILVRVYSAYCSTATARDADSSEDFVFQNSHSLSGFSAAGPMIGMRPQQFLLFAKEFRLVPNLSQAESLAAAYLAFTLLDEDISSAAASPLCKSLLSQLVKTGKIASAKPKLTVSSTSSIVLTMKQFFVAVRLLLRLSFSRGQRTVGVLDEECYFEPLTPETGLSPEGIALRLAAWRLAAMFLIYQPASRMAPPWIRRHYHVKLPSLDLAGLGREVDTEEVAAVESEAPDPLEPDLQLESVEPLQMHQSTSITARSAAARRASVAMRELNAQASFRSGDVSGAASSGIGRSKPSPRKSPRVRRSGADGKDGKDSQLWDATASSARKQIRCAISSDGTTPKALPSGKHFIVNSGSPRRVRLTSRPNALPGAATMLLPTRPADEIAGEPGPKKKVPPEVSRHQERLDSVLSLLAHSTELLTRQPLLVPERTSTDKSPAVVPRPPAEASFKQAALATTARVRLWSGSLARMLDNYNVDGERGHGT